ncbi:hypothetical protein GALMADRAFT_1312234 [Galerina marginata CBS 339.88]|uniref:Uncharacterized protein n=1 Tax=Galerina marginata (strain CBS 339.88) TaxID=685588 RepID=A0A067TH34_GALM3|nr:hypothetical protein GALMADRAFT_1312234 [Galerina marginata CBS 339.88]
MSYLYLKNPEDQDCSHSADRGDKRDPPPVCRKVPGPSRNQVFIIPGYMLIGDLVLYLSPTISLERLSPSLEITIKPGGKEAEFLPYLALSTSVCKNLLSHSDLVDFYTLCPVSISPTEKRPPCRGEFIARHSRPTCTLQGLFRYPPTLGQVNPLYYGKATKPSSPEIPEADIIRHKEESQCGGELQIRSLA